VCYVNTESGLALASSPFRCCQMPNFIGDEHFLEGLRNELSDLICYEKNNDLYKFHQVHYLILIVFDLPYSLMVCMDQAGAGRTSKFT